MVSDRKGHAQLLQAHRQFLQPDRGPLPWSESLDFSPEVTPLQNGRRELQVTELGDEPVHEERALRLCLAGGSGEVFCEAQQRAVS